MSVFHRLTPAQLATHIAQLEAKHQWAKEEYQAACEEAIKCAPRTFPDTTARINKYALMIRSYRARIRELSQLLPSPDS